MPSTEAVHSEITPVYRFTDPFPVARYRFVFSVVERIILPGYAGSAIRGVFGHALKRNSCITGLKECEQCGLKKTCPYTGFFAPTLRQEYRSGMKAEAANPYVIEAPWDGKREYKPGECFEFSVVLIGPALKQLALCIHAMRQAFYRGIGPANGKANLTQVAEAHSNDIVWSAEEPTVLNHKSVIHATEGIAPYNNHCTVNVQTPLRIASKGRLLKNSNLNATDFLMTAVRRVAALVEGNMAMTLDTDFAALRQRAQQVECNAELRWREWERYSNRQKQSMKAGGVTGHIELSGELEPFLPFLKIASYVHIGKMTSFGNGKVQLGAEEVKSR